MLQGLVDWYREQLVQGASPDPREILARHPEIADHLEPRLRVVEMLQRYESGVTMESHLIPPLSDELTGTVAIHATLESWSDDLGTSRLTNEEVLHRLGFEVIRKLGQGAIGQVYLARQGRLERQVAVKVTANEGREGPNLAQLQHDHIVRVHVEIEVPAHGLRVLCMEFVPGATLAEVVDHLASKPAGQRGGRGLLDALDAIMGEPLGLDLAAWRSREQLAGMDAVEAVCWMGARLADALAHAHHKGILHRDIKPANILVHASGRPLLVDFNLASNSRSVSEEELFGGTPVYMAPEHLEAMRNPDAERCLAVDHRSDLYSLGVVLFELLTGQRPFDSVPRTLSRAETLQRMAADRQREPPSARGPNPLIPVALDRVIRRCLDPDPNRRFQTAEELTAVLDGCRELHGLHRSLPPAGTLTRTAQRHPQHVGILLPLTPHLIGALVCFASSASWMVGHEHRDVLMVHGGILSGLYSALVFPLTGGITYLLARPIWRTLVRLRDDLPVDADEVAAVRQRALRKPFWGVLLSAVGWLPGAVLLPTALYLQMGEAAGWDVFLNYFLSFLIAGLIALTYTEFIDQFLLLRIAYPTLWIEPRLPRQLARAELATLDHRLRWFQILSTFIPLATAAALLLHLYHRTGAGRISAADRASLAVVLALVGFGLAGSWLAVLISGYLNRLLAVLKE